MNTIKNALKMITIFIILAIIVSVGTVLSVATFNGGEGCLSSFIVFSGVTTVAGATFNALF